MGTEDADRPPHVRTRLKQAPKLRDLYWCDLPRDAQLPEFWKRRPVIVIAGDGTLSGAVQVVPCSSQPQGSNRWAHRLGTAIDGVGPSWAVCDKFGTVAISRLSVDASQGRPRRVTQDDFTAVLGLVLARLPKLQAPTLAPGIEISAEIARPENHAHMVALYAVWYNFVRFHKSLRVSPAMAAGISDRLWSMEDLAALVEAADAKPGRRGAYKKRTKTSC